MKLTGENRSTQGKTRPSATLSTTNPTWTDPGSKPGLSGERRVTNRLSHGTALIVNIFCMSTKHEVSHYAKSSNISVTVILERTLPSFLSSQKQYVNFVTLRQ
jgi:hypothetical protein